MISIKNILTISKYESKVLWRNWFFRIIGLAGLFFVTIFNIGVYSEVNVPRWYALANSAFMPYSAMVMISIPQAAAVIFLATGLIKKDKKIDTNEVFFVRAISNLDYVLGKALALFKLFFLLNFVLLLIPVVVNLTSPYTTFDPIAFIMYPLLVSVPSIIFTTGIAFLLVTLLKNQPITIVLLLGVAGVQLIYYFDQFSNIFDFMAFRLSLLTSEIAGFVNMEAAIWQRMFYVITGIAFLFMTAFFLDRLASHKISRMANGFIGIVLLGLSSYVMIIQWDMRKDPTLLRNEMITENGKWADEPNIDIVSNFIQLELVDEQISTTADIVVKNNTNKKLHQIYFTLNPGLVVDELLINDRPIEVNRSLQIVSANNGFEIGIGEKVRVQIKYHGIIKESAAHLEVAQERYEESNDYFMYSLQKKYAFLQSDYVLLTKDVLWYPDTQIGYSREATTKQKVSFIDFQLDVKVAEGQLPVSQGASEVIDNIHRFRPEFPLPQISLVIGDYLKKEIIVDSIAYQVYHYPKNDYFIEQLNEISDTLSYLITDITNEYEDGQKLSYPFKRMQFVEVPVQFTAYSKIYDSHQAFLQPETVFWPEEGGRIRQFDFRRQLRDMKRQAREENQELSDKQKQANVFNDLVKKVFTKQIGSRWVLEGRDDDIPDYSLFPNYYTYNSGVVSEEWALLNRSIASYLRNDKQSQNDYSRNLNGISFTEECNILMGESTITEILTEETAFNKIEKSVSLKGKYLFSYLGQLIGEEVFKGFLYDWVNTHQHRQSSYEEFKLAILTEFDIDIDPVIKKVYSETSQPAFEVLNLEKYEVLDGDRKRYQVIVDIKNTGDNDGVIEVKFNNDEDDSGRRRVNEEVKEVNTGQLSVIRQGETKQLGFILDEKPNEFTINTIVSRNIPSTIYTSLGTLTKKTGNETLFQGERILIDDAQSKSHEVIVDNEDDGFSTFSPIEPTYLRAYIDSRSSSDKKYYGIWFRSYSKWLATTGSYYYGSVIRSAHFTRAGNGDKSTKWTPEFDEEGFYDIYVYMRGKNQNQYQGNDGDNKQYNYHYIINHGDGVDNIKYNLSNAEAGWNYLGSYFFKKEGGNVMLTDECEQRTVYADAIKWVKQ